MLFAWEAYNLTPQFCLYALSTVYYSCTKMGIWKMLKNRIKEYRAKYDMKQEDLAKLVGVRNIAKVFNISIEDIFSVETAIRKVK